MKIFPQALGAALRRLLQPRRAPDFIIGGDERPYMRRWWLIPRNRLFNIYLHEILRDDDDRALHDHPWVNASLVLEGGYVEVCLAADGYLVRRWRSPGAIALRLPTTAHRLELPRAEHTGEARPSWSLFVTGPNVRTWGFRCPKGWVDWRSFTAGPRGELVGKGCDQ
jgi:hypothetical protein